MLKVGVIDLDFQGHLAILKRHSTSLLYLSRQTKGVVHVPNVHLFQNVAFPITYLHSDYRYRLSRHLIDMIVLDLDFIIPVRYEAIMWTGADRLSIDPPHISPNALNKFQTMHHFLTEMSTLVHISLTKRCVVGYGPDALWDMCNIYWTAITDAYYKIGPQWKPLLITADAGFCEVGIFGTYTVNFHPRYNLMNPILNKVRDFFKSRYKFP